MNGNPKLSQLFLFWRRFKRNKLALIGLIFLMVLYVSSIFAGFIAPYPRDKPFYKYKYTPPQLPHFVDKEGNFHIIPFVYPIERTLDERYQVHFEVDKSNPLPIKFFVRGDEYKLLGLFTTDIHLFGVEEGVYFPFGTDYIGRDLFSRILYGSRITLSISLLAVIFAVVVGSVLGSLAGYYSGMIDFIIQRVIEFIRSFPRIPLWIALSAVVPASWTSDKVYLAMAMLWAFLLWASLARQIRGKALAIRKKDYIAAVKALGGSDLRIIIRHIVPNCMNHIIVITSLYIPIMIIAESTLSFLGLGIRPPMTSWGVLMKRAQRLEVLMHDPWVLIPGLFVIFTCMAYNFVGEGLRDTLDPHTVAI